MEKFIINGRNRKVLAKVFFCLENFQNKNKVEIVESIIRKLGSYKASGYAGYKNDKELKEFLEWAVFGRETTERFNFKIDKEDEEKIKRICKETIKLCENFIGKNISMFIFPTFDRFVIENMGGCGGFSSNKETILITINFVSGWGRALRETICHELSHAISPYCTGGEYSLGEGFILDGIAEHFREHIVGGERAPWTKTIKKEETIKILRKLKDKLGLKDQKLWESVFFGGKDYPRWTGYSIGYYLMEDYLKKQKTVDWKKIIKTPPKKILNEILSY